MAADDYTVIGGGVYCGYATCPNGFEQLSGFIAWAAYSVWTSGLGANAQRSINSFRASEHFFRFP